MVLAAGAALALVLTGCGSGDEIETTNPGLDTAEQQTESAPNGVPSPAGSVFTSGEFDAIPRFRGADAIQEPTQEDGGVITATYLVEETTPREVLDFFTAELADDGWTLLGAVEPLAGTGLRGDWQKESQMLEISAFEAPTAGETPPAIQYSVVLSPAEVNVGADDPGAPE